MRTKGQILSKIYQELKSTQDNHCPMLFNPGICKPCNMKFVIHTEWMLEYDEDLDISDAKPPTERSEGGV